MKRRLLVYILFIAIISGCRKDNSMKSQGENPPETNQNKDFAVSGIFQNNMVIQRDKPTKIWGYANASSTVIVTASWQNNPISVVTSSKGEWEAVIQAAPANANPQNISIATTGQNTILLNDILIGDVWICAGQSNMVMPVGPLAPSFGGVENFVAEIASANYPQIRSLTIKSDYKNSPSKEFTSPAAWEICSSSKVDKLGATAYFFAKKLHQDLNVPIGIIISAINGSWCENWTNREALQADPLLSNYVNANQSSALFNGMISPLCSLSIKGFTWYQGENNQNINPPSTYTKLNTALIKGWRSKFNQSDLPFYYVQITPFDDGSTNNPTLNYLARFREAQMNTLAYVTDAGMVVTMDIGEVNNHHPRYKKEVGDRLALLALNKAYGKDVQCVGPKYASFTQNDRNVTINFVDGTANGLNAKLNAPISQVFFVASADKVFKQATAIIRDNKIILTVPADVKLPVAAVRYAFTNYPMTNLQNNAGLPIEPFRTDDWSN